MHSLLDLPKTSEGNTGTMDVVGRFIRMTYFLPTKEPAGAQFCVYSILQENISDHGALGSIVNVRNSRFTKAVYQQQWENMKTSSNLCTKFRLQADGLSISTDRSLPQR